MLLRDALVILVLVMPLGTATLTDPIQNDANSGGDAGDSMATATPLAKSGQSAAGQYHGFVMTLDDPTDWYQFVTPEPRTAVMLTFAFKPLGACNVDSGIPITPVTVELRANGELIDARSFKSPCNAQGKVHGATQAPSNWAIGMYYDRTSPGTPAGTTATQPTASAAPGLASDYAIVLGCEPHC
ncbi:MAG: hypothetical protein WDA16_04435 [Candidatus Thermoplasmatota archaeon]